MTRLVLKRLASGIVVLWVISVAVFALFFIAPNDVAQKIAGRQATPLTVALVTKRLGLNRPILDQYGSFAWQLLHGNLGYSYYNSEPVLSLIGSRIGVTISLVLGGAVLWLADRHHHRRAGRDPPAVGHRQGRDVLRGVLLLDADLPAGPHPAVLPLLPAAPGTASRSSPAAATSRSSRARLGWAQHLMLPWIAVALTTAATYTRLTRAGMLDVLGEDYIRTARAKGVAERPVTYRHALRAALTSVVTQLGIDVGVLLGGAVVTENIFGLPGLGQLAVQSVTQQDLPVIIGIVMLAAAFVVVANFAVDMFYAVLDPRVRAH